MSRIRPAVLASVLLAVVGLVLLSRTPADALSPAASETHMGRPPRAHVTLVHSSPSNAGYVRQLADGSYAANDFVVPAQQLLVVTDVEVTFRRTAADAGETVSYYLESTLPAQPSPAIRARLQATLNSEGNASAERQILSGIIIASGASLVDNLPELNTFDVAVVRGYLLPTN